MSIDACKKHNIVLLLCLATRYGCLRFYRHNSPTDILTTQIVSDGTPPREEDEDLEQCESSSFVDMKTAWLTGVLNDIVNGAGASDLSILELSFCKTGTCEPTVSLSAPNAHVSIIDVSDFMKQTANLSAAYDVVVCIDVFARVVDPVKAFEKVANVLRSPGGILLATSPFSGNFRPKSGPPILAKLGNLWFKKMASEQKLILTAVWSEGDYANYLKELSQLAFGCGSIPETCREGWHRGFMVRLEKGSSESNEQIMPATPQNLPPCFAPRQGLKHHIVWDTWTRQYHYRGNPTTRDYWIKEKIGSLCKAHIDGEAPKVLDVSAGNRPYKKSFEEAGCHYFSNEFEGNEQILDTMRGEQVKNLQKHDYLGPNITNTTAPSSHFDIVILTEVLEHVPDAFAAVRELRRVAKVGASILLTSPLSSGPHQLPFHFASGYSAYWYVAVADALGLGVVGLEPQGDVYALLEQECSAPPTIHNEGMKHLLTASLSPEHAIGWMAHLRKDELG